jgi:hypothetical protein
MEDHDLEVRHIRVAKRLDAFIWTLFITALCVGALVFIR